MIDKQLHARLSAAESDELVDLLAHPSLEEAQQLRAYLGPEVYQRMRSLALLQLETDLRRALELNPYFDLLQAEEARAALSALEN